MKIGDSFLCGDPEKARHAAKKFGFQVTIRATKEDSLQYRVWKINKKN